MAINYLGLQRVASNLIGGFGRSALPLILRRDGVTDYPIKGVFVSYNSRQVDGDLIRRDDRELILPGDLAIEPNQETDVIIDGDDVLQIINVNRVQPGDVVIVWRLQTRL